MILNRANLQAVTKSLRAVFMDALSKLPDDQLYKKLAMIIPSSNPEETLSWLGELPFVKEWKDERVIELLSQFDYTIRKKDFEATIGVRRDDVMFDRLNLVAPRVRQLVNAGVEHYLNIALEVLKNGETEKCYDGKALFSTTHPGKTNQSNLFVYKLCAKAYGFVRTKMRSLKTYSGRPMNVNPTHLIVPPALEDTAREILLSEKISDNTNIYRNTAEILVIPQLTSDAEWYLAELNRAEVKPFVIQLVKKYEESFTTFDSPDDERVFMKKEYIYGIDGMLNAAPMFWQLIAKGQGSTDI